MLIEIINRILKSNLYVRIRRDWINVRNVGRKIEAEGKPMVRKCSGKLVAVGNEAESYAQVNNEQYELINGFDHPRTIVGQFDAAEAALGFYVRKVSGSGAIIRPIIVIHPKDNYEGGLSSIEIRALRDLGSVVGGREIHVWTGRDLSDDEISNSTYPKHEGELL